MKMSVKNLIDLLNAALLHKALLQGKTSFKGIAINHVIRRSEKDIK